MSDMNQAVQDLGAEFWDWRVVTGYRSPDDVPRLELVPDWIPQFDEDSARHRLEKAADFRQRWEALDVSGEPVPTQVDYRLIGSAISRVEWETRILRSWERDAVMQVHQALGTYYDSLLCPPPFDGDRQDGIIHKLHMVGSPARGRPGEPGPSGHLGAGRVGDSPAPGHRVSPAQVGRRVERILRWCPAEWAHRGGSRGHRASGLVPGVAA